MFQHILAQLPIPNSMNIHLAVSRCRWRHTEMKNPTCEFQPILDENEPNKISNVSNRVSQRSFHKPFSYPTKTTGRQNSEATDMSVPFKHCLDSKRPRQLKASAAIKDCLLYEGVNLLLASYSEGGGGYLWINASVAMNRPARHLAHHLCSSDIIKANTTPPSICMSHFQTATFYDRCSCVPQYDWWELL